MKPSVCLFTDSVVPSGVGAHMLTLVREFVDPYRLTMVCPSSPSGDRLLEQAAALGVPTAALEIRSRDAEPRLAEWLRERRVELLHVHAGIGWEGHHGIYAARRAGVPTVRTEHLPYLLTDPVQCVDYARVQAKTDRLICVSDAARDSYLVAGVPPEKLRVVRNGIHATPAAADRDGVRWGLGLAADALLAITVARFSEQKGHHDLLAAVPRVLEQFPETRLLWIGDGPLLEELRERVDAAGLADRILFLGRRDDVPNLLAASNLLVLPSLFEGLPLVALEAMAAGLPIVGTRVCGTAEVVEDGVTGRLVAPHDPLSLATAILEVLADRGRAERWGAAGRERMRAEFSAERMAWETAAVYEEVLQKKGLADTQSRLAHI